MSFVGGEDYSLRRFPCGGGGYRLTQCSFGRGFISVAEALHVEGWIVLSDSKLLCFFLWGGGYRLTQCSFARGFISLAQGFYVEVCSIFSLAQGFHVQVWSILSDSKLFVLFFFGGGGVTH